MPTYRAFGDSFTNPGTGATTGNSYLSLLSAALGVQFVNYAASGAQAADQSIQAHNINMLYGDKATVMVGVNDQWKYGVNDAKRFLYKSFLTSIIAALGLPSKVNANSAEMVFSGTWSSSQPSWSRGKWSYTSGSTAVATVNGTTIYIGVIRQDNLNGNVINGTADVYVDSVKVGSITSAGTGMTTNNGNTYAPAVFRFGGLSDGSHIVKVIITSSVADYRGMLYLEYIASNSQEVKPELHFANITNMTQAAYVSFGGSENNTKLYCAEINQVYADALADGLNIKYVDVNSAISVTSDMAPDGCHLNNSGHLKTKNMFLSSFTGGISRTKIDVYLDNNDGYLYDGVDASSRRILTS